MNHWDQRLVEFRHWGQVAWQNLDMLRGLLTTAFLPAALGSLIVSEGFIGLPDSLVILVAVATVVAALAGLFYTHRFSSAAGAAIAARRHTAATLDITNPKLLQPPDFEETLTLQKKYRFRYFYYLIFVIQTLFSGSLLFRNF